MKEKLQIVLWFTLCFINNQKHLLVKHVCMPYFHFITSFILKEKSLSLMSLVILPWSKTARRARYLYLLTGTTKLTRLSPQNIVCLQGSTHLSVILDFTFHISNTKRFNCFMQSRSTNFTEPPKLYRNLLVLLSKACPEK